MSEDSEKLKEKISTQSLGIIIGGAIAGLALLVTSATKVPYPSLQDQPVVVQQVYLLEDLLRDQKEMMQKYDPKTIVTAAKHYAKDEEEYEGLIARKDVQDALKKYHDAYAVYMAEVGGITVAPVFAAIGLGALWERRQYKKYGLKRGKTS